MSDREIALALVDAWLAGYQQALSEVRSLLGCDRTGVRKWLKRQN